MNKLIWIAGLITLICSCGGKDSAPGLASRGTAGSAASDTGGRRSTGGSSSATAGTNSLGGQSAGGDTSQIAGGSGGQSIGGATQGAMAPILEIVTPAAVSNPDNGSVLVDATVDVVCKITKSSVPGASDVAASSVKISLIPLSGSPIEKTGASVATQPNEYTANFTLTDIPNGPVSFQCKASDQSTPTHSGSSPIISTFVDHGPTISDVIPVADTAFPLKGSQHFEFKVVAAPLAAGDQGADVGDVTLTVNTYVYTIVPSATSPGLYSVEVNFSDPLKFVGLTGKIPIVITAPNKRGSPRPAVSIQSYYIVLDGDPPTVSITSPDPSSVIGGQRTLSFVVTDTLSGVDASRVFVNLGSDSAALPTPYQFKANDPAWTKGPAGSTTNFTFTFDSTKFDATDSQVTVSIQVTDLAGNEATSTTIFYYLDNAPPFVSLDPPNIRLLTPHDSTSIYCSAPFDPLGPRAPNAGMIVNSFEFYRAFAWDQTNGKASQSIFYFSGIDPAKVHLYLQPDPTKRVVFDKTGDGICDSIDDAVKLLPFQPNLNPVTETGAADNNPIDFTTAPDVSLGAGNKSCFKTVNDPPFLCTQQASDMTVVVHQTYGGQAANDAAIYAPQVKKNDLTCTGSEWDISNFVPVEGWVCLAAEATDGVGNVGISSPIAVCFDNELTPTKPACATSVRGTISTAKPPSCITDGCKPPSKSLYGDFDGTTGKSVPYDIGNPILFAIQYR